MDKNPAFIHSHSPGLSCCAKKQLYFPKESWQNITVTELLKALLLPFQNLPQGSSEEES